ncbi:MAG: hypothetical protein QOJ25_1416 [Solirubrobacteraceae bacterium]|jgi:hypothetical protein|nr:hypothetical protein [Solirubrobacteraceae bacterium]
MSRRRLGAIPGRSGRRSPPPETTDVTATFPWCLEQGVETRPHYLWGTLLAVRIAKALGLPSVAAVEFGVAGGNGLLALERAAAAAAELSGVEVEVYGFDIGSGMPEPVDPRDAPWLIEPGWFAMDEAALRARLTRAQLVLGPVAETVAAFALTAHAPIGFIAFDLDYYSATMDAFGLLEGAPERLLPRISAYFDDVFGYGWSEFTGERAAIADFNAARERRKIGKIHGMRYSLPPSQHELAWHEQMYLIHLFDHPEYSTSEGSLAEGWLAAHRLAPEE